MLILQRNWIGSAVIAAGLLLAVAAQAQTTPAPATPAAPAAATVTATCKDGTAFSGTTMKGACKGHGGVNKGAAATPAATGTTAAATTPASTAAPTATTTKKGPQPPATAKPGGGPGLVWVNSDSKAYHCNGSRWYGKTKTGEYMSESAAKTAGYHAAQNKACTS